MKKIEKKVWPRYFKIRLANNFFVGLKI